LNVHGILITVVQTGSVGVWGWDKLLLSLVAGQVPGTVRPEIKGSDPSRA
jgi:hypothetical protein